MNHVQRLSIAAALACCATGAEASPANPSHQLETLLPIDIAGPGSAPIAQIAAAPVSVTDRAHGHMRRQVGTASWYGTEFQGSKTASGKRFDQAAMTAAHPSLPLRSKAKVTNLSNGRSVVVEITDRGPSLKGRVIDLSQGAANTIGMVQSGIAVVAIEPVGQAAEIARFETEN